MPKWKKRRKKNLFKSAFLPFFPLFCYHPSHLISKLSHSRACRVNVKPSPKASQVSLPYTQLHSAIESPASGQHFRCFSFVCASRLSSRHLTQIMKRKWMMSTRKARSKSAWRKSTWPKDLCRWIKAKKREEEWSGSRENKSEEKSWTNRIARNRARKKTWWKEASKSHRSICKQS